MQTTRIIQKLSVSALLAVGFVIPAGTGLAAITPFNEDFSTNTAGAFAVTTPAAFDFSSAAAVVTDSVSSTIRLSSGAEYSLSGETQFLARFTYKEAASGADTATDVTRIRIGNNGSGDTVNNGNRIVDFGLGSDSIWLGYETGSASKAADNAYAIGQDVVVTVLMDVTADTYDILLDGILVIDDRAMINPTINDPTNIDFINFSSSENSYTLDDVFVGAIPEPASLALLGAGGLLLSGRRHAALTQSRRPLTS